MGGAGLCLSAPNLIDVTGRAMNLRAFLVVDSFWTPAGETGAVREIVVSAEIGENGACSISFEVFNIFCASGKVCWTNDEEFKSLFCCVLARLSL